MRRNNVGVIAVLTGLLVQCGYVSAGTSPLIYAASPYYSTRWVWEPLTQLANGSAQVSMGARDEQGQEVILESGGVALFHLPRGYWLRLSEHGDDATGPSHQSSSQQAPVLWSSQGNGLFVPARLQQGSLSGEWLLSPPEVSDAYILLENSSGADARWWLSKVRPDTAIDLYPYRETVVSQHGDAVWNFQPHLGKHLQLSALAAGEQYSVVLNGPGEWRLEARTLLNEQPSWQRYIDLPLSLNDEYWRDWRLHPSTNHNDLLESDECRTLGSRPESLYITLPEGEHKLSFTAPQAMAVRALALKQDDFMFERNQPSPSAVELSKRYRLNTAPSAQPSYDEQLFASLLLDPYPTPVLPPHAVQVDQSLAPERAAARLIEQRYRVWRELPVANLGPASAAAQLIDVAAANPRRGSQRYVLQSEVQPGKPQPLLRLEPGESVDLAAPDQRPITDLKLSLPYSTAVYELTLKTQSGKTTVWRWRPELVQSNALSVASDNSLARLVSDTDESTVATAFATVSVAHDDFPLTLSHNTDQTVWFSPFYRDNTQRALDQVSWQKALNELGVDNMLDLLLSDNRPAIDQPLDSQRQLQVAIWDDWQPLRKWLRSYQKIWTKGLEPDPLSQSPFTGGQVSELIASLGSNSDTDYLLKQLLKGMVVNDPVPENRELALQWLYHSYKRAQDTSSLSAYHSWRFKEAPRQQLRPLADWLVTVRLSAMAARLYKLVDTEPSHLPYQRSLLSVGWQEEDPSQPLAATWKAVWMQDWGSAQEHARQLPEDHPWRVYLDHIPTDHDQVSWLTWVQQAPPVTIGDMPAKVPVRLTASHSGGIMNFYSTGSGLHMQRALAQPGTPATYRVIGPVDLQLAINPRHSDPEEVLNDWIEISANGSIKWVPVIDSRVNPNIIELPHSSTGHVGFQQNISLSLGPGLHNIEVRALRHDMVLKAEIKTPLLLSGLVERLQADGQTVPANLYTAKEVIQNLDVTVLSGCGPTPSGQSGSSVAGPGYGNAPRDVIPGGAHWQVAHSLSEPEFAAADELTHPDDVEQYLLQLLWQWPQTGDIQRRQLIASANAIAEPQRDQPFVNKLLNKLNQDYSWSLVEIITSSAGSRSIKTLGFSENPTLIAREKLYSSGRPSRVKRLSGDRESGFFTRFDIPTDVRLSLTQEHLPYWQAPPAQVQITLNDIPITTVALPPLAQQLTLTIPAGPQHLRLRLEQPSTDHWLYFEAHAYMDGIWRPLLGQQQRRYQVATQQQPLELYFSEPRWLRIDEYREQGVSSTHYWQAQAGQLPLRPPPGQSSAMYRVFSWAPNAGKSSLLPYRFDYAENLVEDIETPAAPVTAVLLDLAFNYEWSPDNRLYGSGRATDGVYLQFQSRLDFDTDNAADDDNDEQFMEAGWRHRRKLACTSCYWRSDVFFRIHNDDDIDVVGTHQWLYGDWNQSSWRWELKNSLLQQTDPEWEWSWLGSAAAIETHAINEKLEHEYTLKLFGRHLSANDPNFPIDNDIYSKYKDEHSYGLKLGTTLRGRPWLDSLWIANASLGSNEDFNPIKPDYLQARVAWRQYWRPLAFSAAYRHRYYLDDDDRDDDSNKSQLQLGVNSLGSFPAGQILQWGASLDYDFDREDFGFALTLSWDHTRGRGIRDFYPNKTSFYQLRKRDLNADMYHHKMINEQSNDEETDAGIVTDD